MTDLKKLYKMVSQNMTYHGYSHFSPTQFGSLELPFMFGKLTIPFLKNIA